MAERVTIKELVVKLLFEGNESGVTKFNQALQAFRSVAEYADAGLRILSNTVRSVTTDIAEQAEALRLASAQAGVAVDQYDALSSVFALAGASADDLQGTLATIAERQQEFVRTGEGAGKDIFSAMFGGPARARQALSDAKTLDQTILLLADGFSRIQDPIKRTGFASDLLGDAGVRLLPVLQQGGAALRDQLEAMKGLGTYSPTLIEASTQMQAGIAGLSLRARGLRLIFGEESVPALAELVAELNHGADALRRVLDPALRAGARFLADGIRALRDVVRSVGRDLSDSVRAIAAFKTGLIFLSVIVGILVAQALPGLVLWLGRTGIAAARAGAQMLAAWVRATLPLILLAGLITGIILLVEDLVTYVQGGESAFGDLLGKMRESGPVLTSLADTLELIFGGGLGEALFESFDALKTKAGEIIDSIKAGVLAIPEAAKQALSALGDAVPDVLKSLGRGLGAIPGAFVKAGSALTGGGGRTNNVSVGGSSVSVAVNGAGDPRAVGAEVARQVDAAVAGQATRAARDLSSALSY